MVDSNQDRIEPIPPEDRERITDLYNGITASATGFARDIVEVWLLEQRLRADRMSSRRLTRATWALAVMTLALVLATVGLIIVTLVRPDG